MRSQSPGNPISLLAELTALALAPAETMSVVVNGAASQIPTVGISLVQTSETLDEALAAVMAHSAAGAKAIYLLAQELDRIIHGKLWALRVGPDKVPTYKTPDQFIDAELAGMSRSTAYRYAVAGRTAKDLGITEAQFTELGATAVALLHRIPDAEFGGVLQRLMSGELTTKKLDSMLRGDQPKLSSAPAAREKTTDPTAGLTPDQYAQKLVEDEERRRKQAEEKQALLKKADAERKKLPSIATAVVKLKGEYRIPVRRNGAESAPPAKSLPAHGSFEDEDGQVHFEVIVRRTPKKGSLEVVIRPRRVE